MQVSKLSRAVAEALANGNENFATELANRLILNLAKRSVPWERCSSTGKSTVARNTAPRSLSRSSRPCSGWQESAHRARLLVNDSDVRDGRGAGWTAGTTGDMPLRRGEPHCGLLAGSSNCGSWREDPSDDRLP